MPSDPNENLPTAVGILLVGAFVPVAVAAVAHDVLALYLSGSQFTALSAAVFAVVAWTLVEEWDLDRPNFLVAAVVGPGVFFVAILGFGVVTNGYVDVFQYLFEDGGYMGYPAAFGAAGFLAVGLSKQFRTIASANQVPRARTVAGAAGAVAVIGLGLVLGANLAAANAVSVTSVDGGVADVQEPALNVTLSGGPADVRVTATAPDGTSVVKRLSRAETRSVPTRVPFRVVFDDTPPPGRLPAQAGTYRVTVVAASGVTVDTATFEAENGRAVSVTEVVAASGELPWNRSADVVVGSPRHDTRVGVVVANAGAFHTRLDVTLETPDGLDDYHARAFFTGPGERVAVAFSLPEDAVETVRSEHDGRVTLVVTRDYSGEAVVTEEVELPAGDRATGSDSR